MPATVPSRPAAGAVIATDWGQDMHDRMYLPKGVIANGTAVVLPANVLTNLNLSGRSAGNAAWTVGDGISLRVPVGQSGWFDIAAFLTVSAVAAGAYMRIGMYRGGSLLVGTSVVTVGTAVTWIAFPAGFWQGNDGDTFTMQGWCSVANASVSVGRLSIRRVSDTLSGS
jgi:hypothetical protein